MRILELKCKKCDYAFTRLVRDKKEVKNEKCKKCGDEVKITDDIYLGEMGCSSCEGCQSGCGNEKKEKNKI